MWFGGIYHPFQFSSSDSIPLALTDAKQGTFRFLFRDLSHWITFRKSAKICLPGQSNISFCTHPTKPPEIVILISAACSAGSIAVGFLRCKLQGGTNGSSFRQLPIHIVHVTTLMCFIVLIHASLRAICGVTTVELAGVVKHIVKSIFSWIL